jgi:mRNA interferase HigB
MISLLFKERLNKKITEIVIIFNNKFANVIIIKYFCPVEILNKPYIDKYIAKHAITKDALQKWLSTVEEAQWKNHNEIKETFPFADYVGNGRYVFNIKGNKYRIVAVVIFVMGLLTIRFIGTHSEYNKIDCKTV